MTDKLREAAQAIVDRWDSPAWGGSAENLRHTGEYIAELRAALSQHSVYQLPDDLYPDSKCWVDGTYAERVEWLHTMYESIKQTLNVLLGQQDAQAVPQGWREFLKEIEWANSGHGEDGDGEAYCVCCDAWKHEGHQPGCKFFAMLNAAPKQESKRVMLTSEEIDEIWSSIAGHSIYAEYQMEIANAMIEAYERKNGIK